MIILLEFCLLVKAKRKTTNSIIEFLRRDLHVQNALNYQEFQPCLNRLNDNFVYDMVPTKKIF